MKHGGKYRPEYNVWRNMIRRCESPGVAGFANYGGRGIRVCHRWRESFAAFLADMGARPSARHEIDRLDNSRHYEPSNCQWLTARENRRRTRRIKLDQAKVAQIKRRLARGESPGAIAPDFGVVAGAIYNIRSGLAWSDVPARGAA